jgi:hypothetical protein
MLIIKVKGGLGNQMFQYALYKSLKSLGRTVKLDISWYSRNNLHNGYELERVFGITPEYASIEECFKLGDIELNKIYLLKKMFFPKKTHYFEKVLFSFDQEVFTCDKAYFEGSWQNEKYFKNIREEILDEFSFKNIDSRNKRFSELISSENSISIHVRRGDYVSNPKAAKLHGNICNIGYYNKAINLMNKQIKDPKYVIFSDDIEWCIENLHLNENSTLVDRNKGVDSYKDMYLMSKCRHNIIANSSFSWWGAWLNRNPEKIVVAPKKWVNNMNTVEICPKEWIQI